VPRWLILLCGLVGLLAGAALPLAPVHVVTTTLTWPATGQPAASTSALFAPYRPTVLEAVIPCAALRATGEPVVVLATGTGSDGLVVTSGPAGDSASFDGRAVPLRVGDGAAADCDVHVSAGPSGVSVVSPDGQRTDLAGQPVPKVFGFRTDLDPAARAGLSVTARSTDPFTTSPSVVKYALIALQLCAAACCLLYAWRLVPRLRRPRRFGWRQAWWVDAGVVATLAGWAVIGPLAVDDGWASMIARNVLATGNPGNYYRWWNASEVPFAFSEELLAPFAAVSVAPLWLRLPSTLLAVATWLVLSRGVLGAALPVRSATVRIRLLAAGCLLCAWLPFNLGTRPESFVALGVTAALACSMRARDLRGLSLLALVVGLTVPISPSGVLVFAPMLVFAPRLAAAMRRSSSTRSAVAVHLVLLSCIATIGLTVIFADQTWDALVTATHWHAFFGPTLPWYDEPDRYHHLLQADQQGSASKRVPVLLTLAMLPIVGALVARRRDRDRLGRIAVRLAAVVVIGQLLLAVSPSKWSYHLGAAAGPFAALLTVGVVLLARRARTPDRYLATVGVAGTVLLIAAASVSFDGPNAWWQPAVYDVPWSTGPPRPLGISLNEPLVWLVVPVLSSLAVGRRRVAGAVARAPAAVVLTAIVVALALLIGSFVAAPLRRPEASLARVNLNRVTGQRVCGLADDVQVLPDGPVLSTSGDGGGQLSGFTAQSGYLPTAPPPDPPGTGASTHVWGSRTPDASATGSLTTEWFLLPPQPANGGVAVSVSGRTDGGNRLALEFGHFDGATVVSVGELVPPDRPAVDENPAFPLWRTIGVDSVDFPAGADRVRIRAIDGRADALGWLAVTGPRLRSQVGLTPFLAGHGPVLLSWPTAFLFPCVQDLAEVSAGVATTPGVVVESPRPHLTEDRKTDIGGVFAGLDTFGRLHEVPSRLVGHPELDWGAVLVSDGAVRDAYQRAESETLVTGIGGVAHPPPEH
jgi:arabinosyltransferase C